MHWNKDANLQMHPKVNSNGNNVTKMMKTKMVLVMLPVAREEGTPVVRPDGTSGVWPLLPYPSFLNIRRS